MRHRLLLLARLRDDLLGEVRGDLLVAQEVEPVLALAARDRAQVGRVGEHLRHRHLGLDLGHAAHGLGAQRAPAARGQVAHHVADRLVGHGGRDEHDRLQQHRLRAAPAPRFMAIEPAILNAISEESTVW